MGKKVLFLIPDGVGIRNYLYSNVITHLKGNSEIAFWSTLPEEAFQETLNLHQIKVDYKLIKLHAESLATRLWKESSVHARLKYNSKKVSNPTILSNWRKNNKNFKLRQLYNLAEIIGNWASKDYAKILSLEEKSRKAWSRELIEYYKTELLSAKISSIFITHQRVANLMPICIAAKELGIKVTTAIYSWDNLPKARLAVLADRYLVWSDYMKEEMQIYYPEIESNRVIVSGTPQFEFYLEKERLVSRSDFAQKYNLDENKKWICFSGDDKTTSPYDPQYLQDIVSSLEALPEEDKPQIIFRRCPADFSDRYSEVLKKNRNTIKVIDPLWNADSKKSWGAFFPQISDVSMLVNLAFHCDLVLNVGSTMAHDFSVFDKPCLYINYDQINSKEWSVKTIYNYQHFRSMGEYDAVGWLNSGEEILYKIQTALGSPHLVGKDRKEWMEKIVNHPLEENSGLIAKHISE